MLLAGHLLGQAGLDRVGCSLPPSSSYMSILHRSFGLEIQVPVRFDSSILSLLFVCMLYNSNPTDYNPKPWWVDYFADETPSPAPEDGRLDASNFLS